MNTDRKLINSVGHDADDLARAQRIAAMLDVQTGELGVATQMRLNDMRAQAVAATRVRAPFWRMRPVLSASFALSTLLACVLLLMVERNHQRSDAEAVALFEATFGLEAQAQIGEHLAATAALIDADSGLADSDEAMVALDLEFYAWLAENPTAPGAHSGSGS